MVSSRQPGDIDRLPAKAVIYGAGGFGVRMAAALVEAGSEVLGFVDQSGRAPVGSRLLTLDDAVELSVPMFLGISNPGVSLPILMRELSYAGVQEIVNPVQASILLHASGIILNNYWMTGDTEQYRHAAAEIENARDALADSRSKQIFDAVTTYRSSGLLTDAAAPDLLALQYFPEDVPFLTDGMRFVDIGAFDGDTVRALREIEDRVEALLSLEPDPSNFLKLAEEIRNWSHPNALAFPLALGNAVETLRFNANSSASASKDDQGSTYVQSVRFDDLAPAWHPTHVKMDVEGAEPEVLEGMERTLREFRPALAISVYHTPEHHWSILNWVKSLSLRYSFYMRIYGNQTFDTVLYCVPDVSEV